MRNSATLRPMSSRKNHKRIAIALVAVTAALAALRYSLWRLVWNDTPSEPRGLYLVHVTGPIPVSRLAYGALVQFHYVCPQVPVLVAAQRQPVTKGLPAGITRLTCLDRRVAPYPDGTSFIKRIEGKPGDILTTRRGCVTVRRRDGKARPLGCALRRAPDGRPVPYRMHWKDTPIPRGQFYAGSTRVPQSYDSRYFGLVKRQQIIGTVQPLWTTAKRHVSLS